MSINTNSHPQGLLTEFGLPRIGGGEVQPGEAPLGGQGESEGTEGSEPQGFVESYLENVPEDYREHVEPYVREVERNTNKQFQDHAEYRKQWGPYEELGLNDIDPEAVQELLSFAEIAADEDAFRDWVAEVAGQLGIIGDEGEDESDYWGQNSMEDDEWDEDDPGEVIDQSAIQQAVAEQLNQALTPVLERFRQEDMQAEVDAANQYIDNEIKSLHDEHGDFDEDAVYRFALAYDGEDAIKQGFADYMDMLASIESQTLERKSGMPSPPEGEGRANTVAKGVTEFDEAKKLARERFAHS